VNKSTLSVHRLYSKCPPLAWTHARCLLYHWSIARSKIVCSRPHQISMSRRFNSSILDLSVVETMLHDSTDHVIHRTEIWAVWRPEVGCQKVWHTQQFSCCTCAAQCALSCGQLLLPAPAASCWNTKSLLNTAYRWQQYDVIMTS